MNTRLLLGWVAACAAAELLGIALGALWWVAMDQVDPQPVTASQQWLMLSLKALSGFIEGVVLGGLQALLLRRIYAGFPTAAWIAVTSGLAILGWGIGSSFAIFSAPQPSAAAPIDFSASQTVMLAAAFGLLVGALFGAAQASVLRRVAERAHLWILGNMTGWGLALPAIYLAASHGSATAPWDIALAGLASGGAAGLLLGLATGITLRFMPRRDDE